MHRHVQFTATLALLACFGAVAAADPATIHIGTRTVTKVGTPVHAPVLAPVGAAAPARTTSFDPWTQLGPDFAAGRMLCTASYILNQPDVAAGSDGCGYWSGYALADAGWTARGNELGGGVAEMSIRLNFPAGGGYVERQTVIRTDGAAFFTDNDGVSWTPCTLNTNPGETFGKVVRLGYDSGSINVAYSLAEIVPSVGYPDGGYQFLRSFDGGATFDPTTAWTSKRIGMWSSRTGSGQILVAYEDQGNVTIELSTDLGGSFAFFGQAVDPDGESAANLIAITAQEAGAPNHVWLWENGYMQRTIDGGANFAIVRPTNQLGAARGLGASILNPDLIVWTTATDSCFFSRDGGVTDSAFANNWPGGGLHQVPLNVDCHAWNFGAPTRHYAPRRSAAEPANVTAPGDFERLFISTGSGVWLWAADMAAPEQLTNYRCYSSQWHDLVSLRDGHPYDVSGGLRDWGAWGFGDFGSPPENTFWTGGVTSGVGNDVSNAVTNFRPTPADPVQWTEFTSNLLVVTGNGVFAAAFAPSTARHNSLSADPTNPYIVYTGGPGLNRTTFNRFTNTFATSTVYTPPSGADVTAFAIAPSNPSRWYLADSSGTLYWSANAGAVWNVTAPFGAGPHPNDPYIHSPVVALDGARDEEQVRITVHPTNPLEAWIAGSTIQHTTDGGVHWNTATAGLPAGAIRAWKIAYDGTSLNKVYLAAGSGPYVWNGSAWVDLAPSGGTMPAVECRSVEAVSYRGVMRFATWGRGVWDYATGNTLGVSDGARLTLELAPSRNPLQGTGRLEFTLPADGPVTLELIDVTGRRAAMLLDGVQPAGHGAAFVDAASYRPGVYFARLSTRQGTRTAKLVLTR